MSLVLEGFGLTLWGERLVAPFSLSVPAGEIVTVMGPSGSGKSSLLSAIAGTEMPEGFAVEGEVWLEGRKLNGLPPEARAIGRLFQDDLLFPHLSVGQNLLFGMPRGPGPARHAAMEEALAEIGLEGFGPRAPHTLSGGQRQRVALMRSLLAKPRAMLLDEPFSRLDAGLRSQIRSSTFELLKRRGTPTVLVSHDAADVPEGGRVYTIENGILRDV